MGPTSRGRAYRIPNTSDSASSTGATIGGGWGGGSAPSSSSSSAAAAAVAGAEITAANESGGGGGDGGGDDNNDANDGQSFLWATREMAALDFLTNVPLGAERDIVRVGLSGGCVAGHRHPRRQGDRIERRRQGRGRHPPIKDAPDGIDEDDEVGESVEVDMPAPPIGSIVEGEGAGYFGKRSSSDWGGGGRWWDKLVLKDKRFFSAANQQAAVREWEIRVTYGNGGGKGRGGGGRGGALLDGRVFFATRMSYPVAVFSTIKYEPKKEETLRRRKQLEELGGGGTQFVLPERDWRGISYRALLPQKERQNRAFNRLIGSESASLTPEKRPKNVKPSSSPRDRDQYNVSSSSEEEDDDGSSDSSSAGSAAAGYPFGFLDDPNIVHGRNRNVMMGDKVTGPIISSTILFVKPSALKAELNKQFRERFDQWEPPKARRKYICAKVIDGVYTLIDPTESMHDDIDDAGGVGGRRRSATSSDLERETIRMPPSLTLSKIRSLKQQALVACVRARIEISSLALAIIYFERLCLDCRVDKSNRRLSFAACLLLASKVNESNSIIAYDRRTETKSDGSKLPLMTTWVKPSKKSGKIFESLIVFFTNDWSLSLKQLYAAEWIVFTALGFSLKAKPSDVAFHFKRLLRVLEWDPRSYLGSKTMYDQWQDSLMEESLQNERRKARRERRQKRNERKLLKLQRKLHIKQSKPGEELPGRSSRKTSTDIVFRRHSVDAAVHPSPCSIHSPIHASSDSSNVARSYPHLLDTGTNCAADGSPGRQNPKKAEGVAIRGILSRLRMQPSQGDKIGMASLKHSASVPNLPCLDSKLNDFVDHPPSLQ
ncbi:hypothetical protein ACHAXA_005962 [Cyclostephanos tholiformis]|uniref:Cyclin N-terminal domain-containing protein n=1 Tax=Cyclostephanos tholiformis TaxID=382380 RepID=A0ABD3SE34_9STRA